jgi:4-hydroxy-tetrahydrodipicolinate synthase
MTGFGFPEMMVDISRLSGQGNHEKAMDVFEVYLPLVRYEQQPGIGLAVRKYVLAKRGAIASATQRRPGAALNAAAIAEVDAIIARQTRKLEQVK